MSPVDRISAGWRTGVAHVCRATTSRSAAAFMSSVGPVASSPSVVGVCRVVLLCQLSAIATRFIPSVTGYCSPHTDGRIRKYSNAGYSSTGHPVHYIVQIKSHIKPMIKSQRCIMWLLLAPAIVCIRYKWRNPRARRHDVLARRKFRAV